MTLLVPAAQAQSLPAGRPAGVRQAQFGGNAMMVLAVAAGAVLIIGGLGVAMGNGMSSSSGTSS